MGSLLSIARIRIARPWTAGAIGSRFWDLTGRTLKSQKVGNTRSFKTSIEGDPGIYFVELETEDGRRAVRKVVKE